MAALLKVVTIVYVLALTAAILVPPTDPRDGAGWDTAISPELQNALHMPAFAVLFLLVITWVAPHRWSMILLSAVALACAVYGLILEWLQAAAIPGRMGSLDDTLLNVAGVVVGVVAALIWRHACKSGHTESTDA
jgi:VanZ family protein